ncbi:MAG TPA: hypothetical protein VGO57_17970 [Verrucomicrobiae bacterium]|jgi:hypothetical protein
MAKVTKILADAGAQMFFEVQGGPDDGKLLDLGKVIDPITATYEVPDGQSVGLPSGFEITLTVPQFPDDPTDEERHFSE